MLHFLRAGIGNFLTSQVFIPTKVHIQKVLSSCIISSPLTGLPLTLVPLVGCKRRSPLSETHFSLSHLVIGQKSLRCSCMQQQFNECVSRAGGCIRRGQRTSSLHPRYELHSETCKNTTYCIHHENNVHWCFFVRLLHFVFNWCREANKKEQETGGSWLVLTWQRCSWSGMCPSQC